MRTTVLATRTVCCVRDVARVRACSRDAREVWHIESVAVADATWVTVGRELSESDAHAVITAEHCRAARDAPPSGTTTIGANRHPLIYEGRWLLRNKILQRKFPSKPQARGMRRKNSARQGRVQWQLPARERKLSGICPHERRRQTQNTYALSPMLAEIRKR